MSKPVQIVRALATKKAFRALKRVKGFSGCIVNGTGLHWKVSSGLVDAGIVRWHQLRGLLEEGLYDSLGEPPTANGIRPATIYHPSER